ncbi:hypothetical protein ASPZODRAFT_70011 [Penicilliopsis zonata CBS 506.65]|uniref:Glutathione S-transferase UstS-like C-terminal domain-containing protein n=1 Tax=Penicilliopsis zonata CBS 506.65 TaxID=1073090 RepID=A0A1L9SE06_9EURO|nr:hypothetical protein ASPZODRAFT_70011 [Penicilliopsis zonata CBS 506.65]OJJ45317.1 hypothetical protein ASPZODRAFT_70011 [Penicilliopsis zonata CBS 506.65]
MASEPVHFFDLYSDFPGPLKSWSPNTLKTRAVLNFKGIPYTQSFTSYPDVKPLVSSLGIPPNKEGRPYTLPTIIHKTSLASPDSNPNGALMDSLPIALHLDRVFPSPPLFPSGDASYALFLAVNKLVTVLAPAFRTMILPRVAEHLDPRGRRYFHETRSAALGKPLDQLRPTEQREIDELWKLAETESAVLLGMLKGREGIKKGPFFEGETAGYADLLVACQLAFIGRFDDELLEKFLSLGEGEFRALYTACLPWLEGQGEDKEWPIQ